MTLIIRITILTQSQKTVQNVKTFAFHME